MELSARAEELLKILVERATGVDNNKTSFKGKNFWNSSDEKREICEELRKKGYIKNCELIGTYGIECIVTEKAFKKFNIQIY